MKKNVITIRVEEPLKKAFQILCLNENTDMSNKLHSYIQEEIKRAELPKNTEQMVSVIKELGYNNVTYISSPNHNGKLVLSVLLTPQFTLKDFLEKNKDKKVQIYSIAEYSDNTRELRSIVD